MTTKPVQFDVNVKDVVITAGAFEIVRAVDGHISHQQTAFNGNSFHADIDTSSAAYFAVTVSIHSYRHNNVQHTVKDKPISLLATFLLPAVAHSVIVCPESSIASIYAFARMTTVADEGWVHMRGTERNMKIAYGMKQQFYKTAGGIAEIIRNSPNGFETNSYPMFNSLCNLFYYCLINEKTALSKSFYDQFLDYAWHEKGKQNHNFLQALRNMLYDPGTNAAEIFRMLADKKEIYQDSLTSMHVPAAKQVPDQWTLTLKANSSGAKNFIPAGAAFVVFDADDNAWIANNFRAGSALSGTHCPVYRYDASPASFSPVQGGGLLGVAFGVAIDPTRQYISFGNFGWGPELNNPQEGSVSRFYYKDGKPVSPPNGYTLGLSRVQGMDYDKAGNLWMASVGCQDPFAPSKTGVYPFESQPSAVVVYLNGDPSADNVVICDEFPVKKKFLSEPEFTRTPYLKIFDVTPDHAGNAYVSCIGNYDKDNPDNCVLSAVYKMALEGKKLVVKNWWFSDYYNQDNDHRGFESLRQVTVNGQGDVIVVGVASSRATVLSHDLAHVKGYYDSNTYAPWGVKIDRQGTVFLANFGHEKSDYTDDQTLDIKGPFGVTMLRDPARPETARLLTVPTGGAEVTLANGQPLYGTQTRPVIVDEKPTKVSVRMRCHQPIMRLTSTNIDGAGNLWCMNNWKPSAVIDVADNPGGDGVMIFLGIAEPE
ncbi:hypothetical protein [Chitinophaga pinensis]|uniref:Uncharacterized protein n=1 Tax=Chitinophaga pinensis (strain ATCC 43595 / DSM 2588 / LMG 13176 / NBRC 15968 / NCIMB 11800 / UQM 2034) TaxID=485918 RepID=A0A979GU79_CHIPD|nr:hypothetical protein [Chitinophaga pinensis]ACU62598.1 hypothetical protein Cpin_5167 [Chitinophaga pinensis DSM 2588]